mmetsp:Transcript_88356/g.156678  ORF Transcript_88356/g.156678 Transcript_88356/m.156678 type:complete len:203 (+) Transcript_88356:2-610(+)
MFNNVHAGLDDLISSLQARLYRDIVEPDENPGCDNQRCSLDEIDKERYGTQDVGLSMEFACLPDEPTYEDHYYFCTRNKEDRLRHMGLDEYKVLADSLRQLGGLLCQLDEASHMSAEEWEQHEPDVRYDDLSDVDAECLQEMALHEAEEDSNRDSNRDHKSLFSSSAGEPALPSNSTTPRKLSKHAKQKARKAHAANLGPNS